MLFVDKRAVWRASDSKARQARGVRKASWMGWARRVRRFRETSRKKKVIKILGRKSKEEQNCEGKRAKHPSALKYSKYRDELL